MAEYAYISKDNTEALMHYGVMGMKWGVRKRPAKQITLNRRNRRVSTKNLTPEQRQKIARRRKALAIGAGTAAAAGAAYGAYRLYDRKVPKYIRRETNSAGRINWPIAGGGTHYEQRVVREVLNPKRKVFKGKDPGRLISDSFTVYDLGKKKKR